MTNPTTALAWEFWRRHRQRIVLVLGTLLAFIVIYPMLCMAAGFDPSREGTSEIARKIALGPPQPTFLHIMKILFVLFLAAGPAVAMVLTLLCVTWMCTFTELIPKTNEFLAFPVRLFALPISTSFLFWRLVLGGMVAVGGLYMLWVHCVAIPQLEIFAVYHNCLGWLTLVVLGQGIAWALAGWPMTRTLAWIAAMFLFLCSPAKRGIVESPIVLFLFLLGILLASVGLRKMRHGQWQSWTWPRLFAGRTARAESRGPKQFSSPAQAQLWFEWRRLAAKICFFTIALAVVPAAILLVRAIMGYPYLPAEDMCGFAVYLAGMPPLIYLLYGISPMRPDQSFAMVRPLTSGELVMPIVKALSLSVALALAAVLAVVCLMPMVGDFQSVMRGISPLPGRQIALVIGVMFLTWRGAIINLCFSLSENRWLQRMPMVLMYGSGVMVIALVHSANSWSWLRDLFFWLGIGLVALKFLLAYWAFHGSVKRRLLAPAAVTRYLAVWGLLVAALLAVLVLLIQPAQNEVLPACLGIILLVPLARIGFSPMALAWARSNH